MHCGGDKSYTNCFQVMYVVIKAQFLALIVDRQSDGIARGRTHDKLRLLPDKLLFFSLFTACLYRDYYK